MNKNVQCEHCKRTIQVSECEENMSLINYLMILCDRCNQLANEQYQEFYSQLTREQKLLINLMKPEEL